MIDSENTIQQGSASKLKPWFKKRNTLLIAVMFLRLLKLAFRIYEYFTS